MVRVAWLLVLLAVSVTSTEKIRGVNLGGWLVLEPWITPKLFEKANDVAGWAGTGPFIVYDEWTAWSFVATHPSIGDSIESHWESWVTQEHLQTLRDAGVNHLRVPVGYWYFEQGLTSRGEPFANGVDRFPKALSYLERMVNEWAKPLGLRVLLDLHTAPGSQNGFDNSGKRGGINMLNGDNTTRWEAVVGELSKWATEKLDADTLWGIEVLNEPAGFYPWMWSAETATINPKGYQAVRGANNDTNVIFQTGFHPLAQQPQYAEPEYHNTWFDDHNYQAFGDMWNELAWQPDGWATHLDKTCAQTQTYSQAPMPTVVGEFSLAVTDCTIYLASGMNGGCDMTADPSCRYAPTPTRRGHQATCDYYNQPAAELAKDYTEFLAEFARAQMDSFEAANGWFFWNFRTEDEHAPAWDFLLGLKQGWIAQNVSQRERFCP